MIVSDLGAMSELPDDAVHRVPVDISAGDLASEIERLLDDPVRLASMRAAGRAFAEHHTPADQARLIVGALFGST